MRVSALALAAFLSAMTSPAVATIVDVTFSSTDGNELSGSFSYDTTDSTYYVDTSSSDTFVGYSNALPMTITLNGKTEILPGAAIYFNSSPSGSSIDFAAESTSGPNIFELGQVELQSTSPSDVTTLPTSFVPSQAEFAVGQASSVKEFFPISVAFSTVSPTPELPAWASMLVGLGLVGGVAWWGSKRGRVRMAKPAFSYA